MQVLQRLARMAVAKHNDLLGSMRQITALFYLSCMVPRWSSGTHRHHRF